MVGICHITIEPLSGMPRVLRECEAAKRMGMDVTVICEGTSCKKDGYQFIGFPRVPRLERMLFRTRKMVDAALECGADIVQLHSPEFLPYAGKLKRHGKKVIFDSHEIYTMQIRNKTYLPRLLRPAIAAWYHSYEGHIGRKIDACLIPCTVNGQDVFAGRAKRSVKIENFPVAEVFPPKVETQHQAIYAGTLDLSRGIANLCEAIMKTDGVLVLCGNPSDQAWFDALLEKYPHEKVVCQGPLLRERLYEEYARSAVGLCTLLPVGQYNCVDNMSTKIYEYMQCGLPTVCSAFPYAARQNEAWHFGICVDPENTDEIASAVQYLFDHPQEACQMGENGRQAVKKVFNWSVEENKLIALYEEILNE